MNKWMLMILCFVGVTLSVFILDYIVDVKSTDISVSASSNIKSDNLPKEIYDAIKSKYPFINSTDDLSYMRTKLSPDSTGEYVVFATVDKLNGFIDVFALKDQRYEVVYENTYPVYNVGLSTFTEYPKLYFASGLGGPGVQENKIHIIRYTQDGYKDVWNGTADSMKLVTAPYESIDGSIKFSYINDDELIYQQLKRRYIMKDGKLSEVSREVNSEVFKYNEQTMRYELEQSTPTD